MGISHWPATHGSVGNGWLRVLHPDDVPATQEAIRYALRTGGSIDIRYRVRRGDEAWRWMRSRGSPRLSKAGKIIGFYGVVEEVHSTAAQPIL